MPALPHPRLAHGPLPYRWRAVLAAAAAVFSAVLLVPSPTAALGTDAASTACKRAVAAAERGTRLPPLLLDAIAQVESGRWRPNSESESKPGRGQTTANREIVAWPWTVMAEGQGRFFRSKAEAIAAVEALQVRGIRNIDVGCMQVNLRYHPDAFADLETAFDPAANAGYAAGFLRDLQDRHRSWSMAVKHYHSSDPDRQRHYYSKVYKAWSAIKRHARQHKAEVRRTTLAASRADAAADRLAATGRAPNPAPHHAAAEDAGNDKRRLTVMRGVANWPPRSLSEQRRAQNTARALAFSPRP